MVTAVLNYDAKGGNHMAQQALAQIKEAEARAQALIKDAQEEAAQIMARAEQEAEEALARLEERCAEQAARQMTQAQADARLASDAFAQETEQLVGALRETLLARKPEAVEAVVRGITA